jgi:Protein of unknown function (DUF3833)
MKKLILLFSAVFLTVIALNSCGGMQPQQFSNVEPRFIPEQYFAGKTKGTGQFWDRFNDLKLNFVVELDGSWDGKILKLTEVLRYDSGETFNRIYEITKINDNLYEVRSADLEGVGKIESFGNTLKWSYYLKQKIGARIITLYFNDWMFLRDGGIVLNRAFGQKWGFSVGEVFMSVQKTAS